ncbi:DHHW family protein [Gorillibacterium sp. sgz500922]|uniref:DHHW family protein n=1 Tax=Gorillibacterium sp. sgz500922 TaxID=3446694 RepID=UPI003F672FED
MTPRQSKGVAAGFVALLFAASLLFLVLPVQSFSETENRKLAAFPAFSWESVKNKAFTRGIDAYLADHFPLRETWVAVKSALERLRLQQESNGIFRGKDGYLLETFGKPDFGRLAEYAAAIQSFADRVPDSRVSLLLAPTSIGMNRDKLPLFAEAFPQEKVNAFVGERIGGKIAYLNGYAFLPRRSDEPLYYRTDHHWTTYGAYLAYLAYAQERGWTPFKPDAFEIRTVTDSFLGSFHTRSQFTGVKPDRIQNYVPRVSHPTTLTVVDNGETYSSLVFPEFLAKKDKYSYFLGGVHALVQIRTELPEGQAAQGKLLVIKDSYAHSVIPFLTQHEAAVDVIDIRYYNGSLADYVKSNGITDVLLLFNTSTLAENTELIKLKH